MTGSVFVCRLIIPYGKGKVIAIIVIVISAIAFQFPMGKVKLLSQSGSLEP